MPNLKRDLAGVENISALFYPLNLEIASGELNLAFF